jgi:hypothetical protein
MKKTQQFLAKLKLPGEDSLEPSKKRFPDGGHYRIEIPSVEGPRVFREVLETAKAYKVPIHRVSQGSGVMLLTDAEIREMAKLGAEHAIEVCLFVGPRASFETGAQAVSAAGKVIGLQHRGADQLVYAIEDVRHACDLGIRSVLPADLGLIWVINEMKKRDAESWTSPDPALRCAIVSVNVPPISRMDLENWMWKTHKIRIRGGDPHKLRLSTPYYLQKKDIDRFLEKFDEYKRRG